MAMTFKQWLKLHIEKLIHIQAVAIDNGADLVIQSWSGMRLHLYMIDQPVRTRVIRRTLADNSAIGINTLFLVNENLVPADGTRLAAPEWLLALQALTGERFYVYGLDDDGPRVFAAHLEVIVATGGEHEVWRGPNVTFNQLRFFRSAVRLRALKGDWAAADFGGGAFWKQSDYRAYRNRRSQEQRQQRQTHWQTWSDFGKTWNGSGPPPGSSPIQEHLTACYQMLGIESSASQEAVKAAFRKRALALHPDTSALPHEEAKARFHALNAAYDYIKTAKGWK